MQNTLWVRKRVRWTTGNENEKRTSQPLYHRRARGRGKLSVWYIASLDRRSVMSGAILFSQLQTILGIGGELLRGRSRYITYLWSSITTFKLRIFFKFIDIALCHFLGRGLGTRHQPVVLVACDAVSCWSMTISFAHSVDSEHNICGIYRYIGTTTAPAFPVCAR